jgi:putative FmdB family regulatory protein
MPIYAYRCAACGHAKDVLQKLSDPLLTTCPSCGAESFSKQLTAAGFQLKGSGWYATDFKGGGAPAVKPEGGSDKPADKPAEKPADKPADKPAGGGDSGGAAPAAGTASASSASTASGGSCACH